MVKCRSQREPTLTLFQIEYINIKMAHAVKDMDDFNNQLTAAGGKLVVVDFFATWYNTSYLNICRCV